MIATSRRAERQAGQEEAYRGNFVSAFRTLHEQGKPWLALDEVEPAAASRDRGFMRERTFMRFMLGARSDRNLTQGVVEYPPKIGARHIVDRLVEDGTVERIMPEAVAEGLVTHLHGSPDHDPHLYRLVPDAEPAPSDIDVAITA